jgi:hypothetical protein
MPGDIDTLEPCRLEQPPQPRRHLAGPKAAQLRQLDEMEPIATAQPLHERPPPPPRARQPVQDNEILPSAHSPPRHTTAIHPDAQHLHPVILTAVVILLGPASLMSRSGALGLWDSAGTPHPGDDPIAVVVAELSPAGPSGGG